MIAGTQLANRPTNPMAPLPVSLDEVGINRCAVGLPVRIFDRLCATIEARVPLGFEDEAGFHFGADGTD